MHYLEEKFQFSWKYTAAFSFPNDVVIISDVMACSMKTTHSTRGKSYENGLSPFARGPPCNVLLLILLTLAPRQRFLYVFILVAFLKKWHRNFETQQYLDSVVYLYMRVCLCVLGRTGGFSGVVALLWQLLKPAMVFAAFHQNPKLWSGVAPLEFILLQTRFNAPLNLESNKK